MGSPAAPEPEARPGRRRAAAAWIGLLGFASYAYFMPAPASNELSRFALVRALVERGTLDIDPYAETTPDVARHGGHFYSDKAPGAAFLAVPVYAVFARVVRWVGAPAPAFIHEADLHEADLHEADLHEADLPEAGSPRVGAAEPDPDRLYFNAAYRRAIYLCNLFTGAVAGALLGGLFFLLLSDWGVPPGRALLATAALALASPIFAYSTVFFGHVLAAAALFAAWFCLESGRRAGDRPAQRWWLGAGACAGLAVLIELPAALGVLLLVLDLVIRPRAAATETPPPARALAGFALGALGPLLALAAYQTAAFGGPLATGYGHLANPRFAAGMSQGLLGVGWPRPGVLAALYFGRARGLFYLSPVLALALAGLLDGLRAPATRRRAMLALALLAAFSLMNAGYYMWWGGAALGPRHLVPALPFLCLGLGLGGRGVAGWRGRLLAGGFGILLVLSLALQLGAVAVSPFVPPEADVVREHVIGHLRRGEVAIYPGSLNLGMLLGLRGPLSLAPLLLLWALGASAIVGALGEPAARSDA